MRLSRESQSNSHSDTIIERQNYRSISMNIVADILVHNFDASDHADNFSLNHIYILKIKFSIGNHARSKF